MAKLGMEPCSTGEVRTTSGPSSKAWAPSPGPIAWTQSENIPGRSQTPKSFRRLMRGSTCSRSEEHTSELQSHSDLVCRLLLEKKKKTYWQTKAAVISLTLILFKSFLIFFFFFS